MLLCNENSAVKCIFLLWFFGSHTIPLMFHCLCVLLLFYFFLHFFSIRSLHSFASSDEMVVAHSISNVTAFSAISFHKNISLNRIEARRFNIISPAFAVGPVQFMWSFISIYFDCISMMRLHLNALLIHFARNNRKFLEFSFEFETINSIMHNG